MRVINVVGARPNFMKVAPVHAALRKQGHTAWLVHTGQHYDAVMSRVFFEELGMPRPDVDLQVGSGSHATQTARIMTGFEPLLAELRPDVVLVAGDVNSTLACALVAAKEGVRVAHLEAGLRSHDRSMPEELNRVVVDHLSDLLLTPSADADANLGAEGIDPRRIFRVGNVMIDSLRAHHALATRRAPALLHGLGLRPGGYAVLTLHRPGNVDAPEVLAGVMGAARQLGELVPVVFPVHPRTRARLPAATPEACQSTTDPLRVIAPLGYIDFLALQAQARFVMTDSGGIQEETTALGVPCLTLRPNTERPITVTEGTNTLVGTDPAALLAAGRDILAHGGKAGRVPPLWDGQTAARVVDILSMAVAASGGASTHHA
ncbi:MAG TPA: UDP-N-acetylglucosamine 2-epimerase (non-hydrolyzing) [Myxococcota bacterium]|nr:UDP-N-acetylglucosamine 2-epimerase (non-hydrolyzing) [Myxococcota bacterium]